MVSETKILNRKEIGTTPTIESVGFRNQVFSWS